MSEKVTLSSNHFKHFEHFEYFQRAKWKLLPGAPRASARALGPPWGGLELDLDDTFVPKT